MVLNAEFVHEIMKCNYSNYKATEQYFPVVLAACSWHIIMLLYKVVPTLLPESVDEILKREHWS